MIFYRLSYHHADEGIIYEWFTNKKEALSSIRDKDDAAVDPDSFDLNRVELPTWNKKRMLRWLNVWVVN